jgi:hypothetical protein
MGKKVLTLDTMEPDRDFIVVNEKPYFLRVDEELSLKQIAKLRRNSRIMAEKIEKLDTSTDDEVTEIEGMVDDMLDMVIMEFPPEIRAKLTVTQKYQVVSAFTTAGVRRRAGAPAGGNGSQPTTDDSSLVSAGITEGTSTTG